MALAQPTVAALVMLPGTPTVMIPAVLMTTEQVDVPVLLLAVQPAAVAALFVGRYLAGRAVLDVIAHAAPSPEVVVNVFAGISRRAVSPMIRPRIVTDVLTEPQLAVGVNVVATADESFM
jgi:hypothetical protein